MTSVTEAGKPLESTLYFPAKARRIHELTSMVSGMVVGGVVGSCGVGVVEREEGGDNEGDGGISLGFVILSISDKVSKS
jgi:hypothetical protein